MKNLVIILVLSVFSILSYEYPKNPSISNEEGNPVSDSTFYFPLEIFIDSIKWSNGVEIKQDTFSVKWFSQELWFSEEPVLSNYYLGRSIYRLTWLRSFHPAVILRLENRNGQISLLQKKMTLIKPWKEVSKNELTEEQKEEVRSVWRYLPDSASIVTHSRKLRPSHWKKFEKLLGSEGFISMPTTRAWEFGTDGSEWILELHKEDKYHVVNRWSPDETQYSAFREIGDYLIDLSSFKKEERY